MGRSRIDRFVSQSLNETHAFGKELGSRLTANTVICFFGGLGSGKTTLIKGLAAGAAGYPPQYVNSPTFVYLNIYEGTQTVYHFDLYRLRDAEEFLSMGFEEHFSAGGICCIEWAERILPIIPAEWIQVHMQEAGGDIREIKVLYPREK